MTKNELIQKVAADFTNVTKVEAEGYVNSALLAITKALTTGEDVKLSGFGTFKVKATKPQTGRNPRTGESVEIPAKKKIAFTPARELKERLS